MLANHSHRSATAAPQQLQPSTWQREREREREKAAQTILVSHYWIELSASTASYSLRTDHHSACLLYILLLRYTRQQQSRGTTRHLRSRSLASADTASSRTGPLDRDRFCWDCSWPHKSGGRWGRHVDPLSCSHATTSQRSWFGYCPGTEDSRLKGALGFSETAVGAPGANLRMQIGPRAVGAIGILAHMLPGGFVTVRVCSSCPT